MTAALTAPFEVAALVLCVAGLAKLRSPDGAARALRIARLPGRTWLVRAGAAVEIALGVVALIAPTRLVAGVIALLFAGFGALSLRLARRQASCGCFGESDAPASVWGAGLSALLGLIAALAAATGVHDAGWVVNHTGAVVALVAAIGIVGAVFAVVLVYTALPQAWAAWSGR
jgi:hypothetical protein